ncbi:uncharacterized protein LOC104582433 [Brachypodium distachyon]|uniref:uncharacterized protein LOC104582433 n=1 Tax=Brachypodium distachyon TaxID=15368 RepID=UPI00071CD6C1|nr:uncharacterized protein LOC104582433 [Brachypodium distachyon]|eukprot:XP_014751837.1 uncharacterized protein LOC104582433 [Brachypodium distachyon]
MEPDVIFLTPLAAAASSTTTGPERGALEQLERDASRSRAGRRNSFFLYCTTVSTANSASPPLPQSPRRQIVRAVRVEWATGEAGNDGGLEAAHPTVQDEEPRHPPAAAPPASISLSPAKSFPASLVRRSTSRRSASQRRKGGSRQFLCPNEVTSLLGLYSPPAAADATHGLIGGCLQLRRNQRISFAGVLPLGWFSIGRRKCFGFVDMLGGTCSLSGVDVEKHRLAACRTMLQKFSWRSRTRLFVADGSILGSTEDSIGIEDYVSIFSEWTSNKRWKDSQKSKGEHSWFISSTINFST